MRVSPELPDLQEFQFVSFLSPFSLKRNVSFLLENMIAVSLMSILEINFLTLMWFVDSNVITFS